MTTRTISIGGELQNGYCFHFGHLLGSPAGCTRVRRAGDWFVHHRNSPIRVVSCALSPWDSSQLGADGFRRYRNRCPRYWAQPMAATQMGVSRYLACRSHRVPFGTWLVHRTWNEHFRCQLPGDDLCDSNSVKEGDIPFRLLTKLYILLTAFFIFIIIYFIILYSSRIYNQLL